MKYILLSGLLVLLLACARAPLKDPRFAMRSSKFPPSLIQLGDDLPLESLLDAIQVEIKLLKATPNYSNFIFGEVTVSKQRYIASLQHFLDLAGQIKTSTDFLAAIERDFDLYEVYGDKDWGTVFLTSYYEPIIEGSRVRTQRFSQPVYRAPRDIVTLDLTQFDPKFSQERKYKARIRNGMVLPYFSRDEIDSNNALVGRGLEICWLDPIDAFLLQVQGSGIVVFKDKSKIRLGYSDSNGQKYESIGKFLSDKIPLDQLNLYSLENYLRSLTPDELQKVLNKNPSYVFFRVSETEAMTSMKLPATDGRTIATDKRFFPKGALAFLISTKPRFETPDSPVPSGWDPLARFVLDQDIGGAIQGGGRVDLFWGRGSEAKKYAGFMKNPGLLYYLVPKAGAP